MLILTKIIEKFDIYLYFNDISIFKYINPLEKMDTDFKGSMFSGELLNEMFPGYRFVILCTEDDKVNYSDTIKQGLYEKPFTHQTASYASGGITFTDQTNWLSFRTYSITVTHYRDVEIPFDSQVFIDKDEYRANKVIFHDKKLIKDMEIWDNKEFCRVAIKSDVKWIKYAKALDTNDYFTLISQNPNLIQHLDMSKVTPSMLMTAVCHDGLLLKYIENQNLQICKLAVNKNYRAFTFAKFQDDEMCLSVLKVDGMLLEYVINQTPDICHIAVTQNEYAIKYVKEQTIELCELAFSRNHNIFPNLKCQNENMAKIAVTFSGLFLEHVINQTKEICEIAVNKAYITIKFAKFQTDVMALNVVNKDGLLLQYVHNKTEDICNAALHNNIKAFEYIENPSDITIITALSKNGLLIKHIKNPSEDMKFMAVENKWKSIEFIEDQTLELCEFAFDKSKKKAFKFCKIKSQDMIRQAITHDSMWLQYVDSKDKTLELCQLAFNKNKRSIEYIPSEFQTEQMMLETVNAIPELLKYIYHPTELVCITAINKNHELFSLIKEPTEDMCIALVSKSGLHLKHVPANLQTPNVCFIAVNDCPSAIEFVNNQTEDLCILAVSQNAYIFKHCKVRTYPVLKALIKKDGYSIKDLHPDEVTLELAELAIDSYHYCLQHIPKHIQTREICLKCIKKSGTSLEFVREDLQDEELCFEAVSNTPYAIKYVKNQTEKICMHAIKNGYGIFEYIKNPTYEMRIAAVTKESMNIKYIENPTREEIKIALKGSKYVLNNIPENKQSLELCLTAIDFEEESYIYAGKYKNNNMFNLISFLVNPNINGKLTPDACEFIKNHPYIKELSQNVKNAPVIKPAPIVPTSYVSPAYSKNYEGFWD